MIYSNFDSGKSTGMVLLDYTAVTFYEYGG